MTVVLASTSRIRAKLLLDAGVEFIAVPPTVDEAALRHDNPQWTVNDVAMRLAEAKAMEVSARMPDRLVIGADQTLLFEDDVLGKPRDMAEAKTHLERLRGKTHELQSSLCCVTRSNVVWRHTDVAKLTMRPFSAEFLETYLEETGKECLSSVGAYKLEERGIQLFERINGSYHTILGLPLLPLLTFLRGEGLIAT